MLLTRPTFYIDFYELTMAQGYFLSGRQKDTASFEYFFRNLPFKSGYVVFVRGLATDFCVKWTALDAKSAGFSAYLTEDTPRCIDLEGSLNQAFAELHQAGLKVAQSHEISSHL